MYHKDDCAAQATATKFLRMHVLTSRHSFLTVLATKKPKVKVGKSLCPDYYMAAPPSPLHRHFLGACDQRKGTLLTPYKGSMPPRRPFRA